MTKEQFDSLYYGKAVRCDTEEKAKEFLALADSVGYKWFGGARATDFTKWQFFKDDTHYFIKGFLSNEVYIMCSNSYYFLKYDIDCVEFIPQNQKFKVDDKVKIKNTLFTDINGRVGIIVDTDLSPMPYLVKIGHTAWTFWLYESQLEKFEEPKAKAKAKAETTQMLIDEIKTKWNEINTLLNRLEKERCKRK